MAHSYAVYGQPNIYGLFMAVCAGLLIRTAAGALLRRAVGQTASTLPLCGVIFFGGFTSIACTSLKVAKIISQMTGIAFTEAMITWATAKTEANEEVVVSSSEGSRDHL